MRNSYHNHKAPIGFSVLTIVALTGFFLSIGSVRADAPVTGAIFTTDETCTDVNVNIYDHKSDVYIDGGPEHPGSAGLPDGSYCVQVTDPSGQTILGRSDPGVVTVVGGEFIACYQLSSTVKSASSGFTQYGYDDTPNEGGEYKVWVSMDCTFPNNLSKTDNFQVENECERGTIEVTAFYDANANGIKDGAEQDMVGWRFDVFQHHNLQVTKRTPRTGFVRVGDYAMIAGTPLQLNWVHTTPARFECALEEYGYQEVSFGNTCLGAGGASSIALWSNKTGQRLITADDLTFLSSLSLRDAKGVDINPATSKAFSDWALNATTANMAYPLSAQLAAMELNVRHGNVNGTALVYAPDLLAYATGGINNLGFISINDLMAAAAAETQAHALTKLNSPDRPYQEALSAALDNSNNNKNFVQTSACTFQFQ